MKTIFDRHDVFVKPLTGFGKSLYYQALLFLIIFKPSLVNTIRMSTVTFYVSSSVALTED